MPRNLLDALFDLDCGRLPWRTARHSVAAGNAVQAMGQSFEEIIKDLLAGTSAMSHNRNTARAKHLSYQGSPNQPPDAMFRGGDLGDAFEIKKHENVRGHIQLNSSWPYDKLSKAIARVSGEAQNCEPWTERDFFYVIGHVKSGESGNHIWVVDGCLIARSNKFYETLEQGLRSSICGAIVGASDATSELGRVADVDKLGASLRIRGMWTLPAPAVTFDGKPGVIQPSRDVHCVVNAAMRRDKWAQLASHCTREARKHWLREEAAGRLQVWNLSHPDSAKPLEVRSVAISIA